VTGIGALALIHGWLATFIYVRLRNSRRAAKALTDAEIARFEAQRNLLAAQLVAAHAQVDPDFVLQALAKVEHAYEEDSVLADALLDEFIAFLREAIPKLRADEAAEAT
jgi:LytS/YehU family sensor histidine kinase